MRGGDGKHDQVPVWDDRRFHRLGSVVPLGDRDGVVGLGPSSKEEPQARHREPQQRHSREGCDPTGGVQLGPMPLPVVDGEAADIMPLGLQLPEEDGGVHPSRQQHHHFHRCASSIKRAFASAKQASR